MSDRCDSLSAGEHGADPVDRGRVGQRVVVDDEQVGVVPSGEPALPVAEADHASGA